MQEGISKYFIKPENVDKLTILSVAGLNEALSLFTDREDKDAFENLVTYVQMLLYLLHHFDKVHICSNEIDLH